MWLLYAVGSSFFAGITSILAKCGIKKTDSDVATAIRTIVVLLFSWLDGFDHRDGWSDHTDQWQDISVFGTFGISDRSVVAMLFSCVAKG